MNIKGQIRINRPPQDILAVLHDLTAVERLFPVGSQIAQSAPGDYDFAIGKSFGPLRLNLPGKLTLTQIGAGPSQQLTVRAAHLVGGKLDFDLELTIQPVAEGSNLSYAGQVQASGLAGRVLKDYGDRIPHAVRAGMTRLKLVTENRARQSA